MRRITIRETVDRLMLLQKRDRADHHAGVLCDVLA